MKHQPGYSRGNTAESHPPNDGQVGTWPDSASDSADVWRCTWETARVQYSPWSMITKRSGGLRRRGALRCRGEGARIYIVCLFSGMPRCDTARPKGYHRPWCYHGTCHRCARRYCRGARHGIPRQASRVCPRQNPLPGIVWIDTYTPRSAHNEVDRLGFWRGFLIVEGYGSRKSTLFKERCNQVLSVVGVVVCAQRVEYKRNRVSLPKTKLEQRCRAESSLGPITNTGGHSK